MTPDKIKNLKNCLTDPDSNVRQAALVQVVKVGIFQLFRDIANMAQKDPDPRLRHYAKKGIALLRSMAENKQSEAPAEISLPKTTHTKATQINRPVKSSIPVKPRPNTSNKQPDKKQNSPEITLKKGLLTGLVKSSVSAVEWIPDPDKTPESHRNSKSLMSDTGPKIILTTTPDSQKNKKNLNFKLDYISPDNSLNSKYNLNEFDILDLLKKK